MMKHCPAAISCALVLLSTVSIACAADPFGDFAKDVLGRKAEFGRTIEGIRYIGYYKGTDPEGCDLVSVEREYRVADDRVPAVAYHYKKCGSREIQRDSDDANQVIPSSLVPIIRDAVVSAQRDGGADRTHKGYSVAATRIRGSRCNVEIFVFKGDATVDGRVVDACK